MARQYEPIWRLIEDVRSRYRAIAVAKAVVRAACSVSVVMAALLLAHGSVTVVKQSSAALVALAVLALIAIGISVVWAIRPLRIRHSDRHFARLVEERVPSLDDRLATAVDLLQSNNGSALPVVGALLNDASRKAHDVDVDQVLPASDVRKRSVHAFGATLVLLSLLVLGREPIRQSVDAASLALFPQRVSLEVTPGDARIRESASLAVDATLVGSHAPATARLEIESGESWQPSTMALFAPGRFHSTIAQPSRDIRYRVVVGSLVSPIYTVRVVRPPHVARIDLEYVYPSTLGLSPRTELDAGDIYAPAGTKVRLRVSTDKDVAGGHLAMDSGASLPMAMESPTQLTATMAVTNDGSYRVLLADPEGLGDDSGNEYFIRIVADRPPEVHIVKPASDRQVTPLEEVDIEAQADDDYGLERVELVYAVRGESEKAVPLRIPSHATTATLRHTIFLEDLGVRPGDFVSYYVRARDVARGAARANEGRSDIFFLEVRPFEQEFSLAESQSMAGSGYNGSIDDLVSAQKQIVVATWKIDRRTQASKGAQPVRDIRALGRSESDLLTRIEEVASSLRESTMRDPRKRLGRSSDPTMPEEQAMAKAVDAMGRAVTALDGLKTGAALPAEMQALNALLEAQALVKRRQVSRQQTAQGGPGNDNRNYDVSTLFDKELQRLEETNYETRQADGAPPADAIADKLKELARRQDELLRREQQLQNLSDEERKRELEKLTREQSELRQQAEELTKSASKNSSSPNATSQLRDVARDMEGATNDLRRQDAKSSQSRGREALEKLQRLSSAQGNQRDTKQGQAGAASDPRTARLREALAKAQQLQQKLDSLTRELRQLQTQGTSESTDRAQLQREAARQLEQTRNLVEQLRKEDPLLATGGPGFTYEGQGMTFSAPGTEAFKQDLSRWESLQDQATRALEQIASTISQRLNVKGGAADRAAAGVDDSAPAAYRPQVDAYFKAIAAKKAQ